MVLIITLILLVVIGISSTVAIRSALVGDLVTNNMRTQNLALQAAEIALRYCEDQALAITPTITIQPLPAVEADNPRAWATAANWEGATPMAVTVPDSALLLADNSAQYNQSPQCLVESMEFYRYKNAPLERAFLITARGFSPDYSRDANGNSVSGSEVWLQSTLRQR